MGVTDALMAAHRARFAAIDRTLPEVVEPREGEMLEAATSDGNRVAGVLHRQRYQPDSPDLLWSAAEAWQLSPFIGDTGTEGMDALLRAWRSRMDAEDPGQDSACMVTWPSRDAEAIRAFLDHGFVPISTLAVRRGLAPEIPPASEVTVRPALPEDFELALALAVTTLGYTSLVGSAGRPNTAELLAPPLRRKLDSGGAEGVGARQGVGDNTVWLAELGETAIGLADCAWIESAPGLPAAELLPHGRWGYLNNVVTNPRARGSGAGRALMSVLHAEFDRDGVAGTYLYYNPPNPLASVFWHRQGYRPLWTIWEVRPASALR